jgi:hypothetical protein
LGRLARCCALRGDNVHRTPNVAKSRRLRRAPSTHSGYFVTIVFLSYPNDSVELRAKRARAVTYEIRIRQMSTRSGTYRSVPARNKSTLDKRGDLPVFLLGQSKESFTPIWILRSTFGWVYETLV